MKQIPFLLVALALSLCSLSACRKDVALETSQPQTTTEDLQHLNGTIIVEDQILQYDIADGTDHTCESRSANLPANWVMDTTSAYPKWRQVIVQWDKTWPAESDSVWSAQVLLRIGNTLLLRDLKQQSNGGYLLRVLNWSNPSPAYTYHVYKPESGIAPLLRLANNYADVSGNAEVLSLTFDWGPFGPPSQKHYTTAPPLVITPNVLTGAQADSVIGTPTGWFLYSNDDSITPYWVDPTNTTGPNLPEAFPVNLIGSNTSHGWLVYEQYPWADGWSSPSQMYFFIHGFNGTGKAGFWLSQL